MAIAAYTVFGGMAAGTCEATAEVSLNDGRNCGRRFGMSPSRGAA
jgi:hypothetical protein